MLGATGLIGSSLLERLLHSSRYTKVSLWLRKPLAKQHPKLQVKIVDFDNLAQNRVDADDVYCCLGTTIKIAGSQEAFRRVDFEYPVALAKAAARDGAKRLLVVSALGANTRSTVFYSRVKGEMEDAVRAAGVPQTVIFQPSLLSGRRVDVRPVERLGEFLAPVVGPLLGKYRPIHGDLVAAAMLTAALGDLPSQSIESDRIRALAQSS